MTPLRKIAWVSAVLGVTLLAGMAFLACVHAATRTGPDTLQAPQGPPGTRYRIGVLGDAQKGLANLSRIAQAVRKEDVSFLLQTGDLVANNDEGHYRLAARYLKRGGATHWPYVVPGNHDVKGGTGRFRRWCGELERSFSVGPLAFVILDNASAAPPDLDHVKERIRAAGPHQAVVLAMHVPPFDIHQEPLADYAPFLEWLKTSEVRYLLCGHVHGYFKKQVGSTTVLVNGVGGDFDAWQFDQDVYATILEVDGTSITDREIRIAPSHEVWENVEHLAIGHFAEAYGRRPVLSWGGTVLLAGLVGVSLAAIRRRPSGPPSPGPQGVDRGI
jgi:hypothetical protein